MSDQTFNLSDSLKAYQALKPQSISGSTAVKGVGIHREYQNEGFQAALIVLEVGDVSGSPSAVALTVKIQHSVDDVDGDYADFTPPAWESAATEVGVAADTAYQLGVDLRGAKEWIRVVLTPVFTGGTTPSALSGVSAILGRAHLKPAVSY